MTDTELIENKQVFPEIIYNLDISAYHEHPAISNSGLTLLAKAPRYYQYERFERNDDKRHFIVGSAYHALLLEKGLFKSRFHAMPETYVTDDGEVKPFRMDARTKTYKKEEKLVQGRHILSHKEFQHILNMAEATIQEPEAWKYIKKNGIVEASIIWQDEENGIQCRCRPDLILPDEHILIDFKTTKDASEDSFRNAIYNYGYDRQAYFYSKGYEAATGHKVRKFIIIAVEKNPPYLVGVYPLDEVALTSGEIRTERLLDIYANCMETGLWPGLNDGKEKEISIPIWAAYKMESEDYLITPSDNAPAEVLMAG